MSRDLCLFQFYWIVKKRGLTLPRVLPDYLLVVLAVVIVAVLLWFAVITDITVWVFFSARVAISSTFVAVGIFFDLFFGLPPRLDEVCEGHLTHTHPFQLTVFLTEAFVVECLFHPPVIVGLGGRIIREVARDFPERKVVVLNRPVVVERGVVGIDFCVRGRAGVAVVSSEFEVFDLSFEFGVFPDDTNDVRIHFFLELLWIEFRGEK